MLGKNALFVTEESLCHLFFECESVQRISANIRVIITLNVKADICYYVHEDKSIDNFVKFIILSGKFFIHKCRLSKSPLYKVFCNELTLLIKFLKVMKNVKGNSIVTYYQSVFGVL